MLPKGKIKRPNEYDHAKGCPLDPKYGLRRGWKYDGGDFELKGRSGACVSWHVNPWHYAATVWAVKEEHDFSRHFKSEVAAMRACERWLKQRGL